jgi:hypothetical protein
LIVVFAAELCRVISVKFAERIPDVGRRNLSPTGIRCGDLLDDEVEISGSDSKSRKAGNALDARKEVIQLRNSVMWERAGTLRVLSLLLLS